MELRHSLALALALVALGPASAHGAGERASMRASFRPEHLGAPSTISIRLNVAGGPRGVPAPLRQVDVLLPAEMGFATSGLGVAACDPHALEVLGPDVCPANSRIGSGAAVVEIPIGPVVRQEHVRLSLFAAPSPDGYLHVLICAVGEFPVIAQIVLTSVLLPRQLQIDVPLVPSLPAAPDVSLVEMNATLGGALTYYEVVHGHVAAYHPRGVGLPPRCPRGGFKFAAGFAFLDGSRASAHTAVPCPRRRRG
jgi:hypothetical protein